MDVNRNSGIITNMDYQKRIKETIQKIDSFSKEVFRLHGELRLLQELAKEEKEEGTPDG